MKFDIVESSHVEKSWGCEIWWASTPLYMGKTLIINPDQSTSNHYHEEKDETITVVRGALNIVDGTRYGWVLTEGMTVHIAPGVPHRLSAGHTGVTLVEVSTPHPNDSRRIEP